MNKRVLVSGSRTIDDYDIVAAAIAKGLAGLDIETPIEIITGGTTSVDKHAATWAEANGIPVKVIEANWRLGKGAGFAANMKLAEYVDVLIAVYDGESKGTQNAIDLFKEHHKPYYVNWIKVESRPKPLTPKQFKERQKE